MTRVIIEVCTNFRKTLEKEANEPCLMELRKAIREMTSELAVKNEELNECLVRLRGRGQASQEERNSTCKGVRCVRARPV